MPRLAVLSGAAAAVALALVACTAAPPSASPPSVAFMSPSPSASVPPELAGLRVVTVSVGEQRLRVVLAENFARGLQGVRDLGPLDGMLFVLERPRETSSWWMKDVHIPLDITWFDPRGRLVRTERMEPCRADPCPVHTQTGAHSWVLETRPGTLRARPGDTLSVPE